MSQSIHVKYILVNHGSFIIKYNITNLDYVYVLN